MIRHLSSRVVLAAILVLACASLAFAAAAQNQPTAESEASSLLAAALLPDGVSPLSAEPADDGGALSAAPLQQTSSNLATKTAFYRSSLTVPDVLAFLESHAPSGSTLNIKGSADTRDGRTVDYRSFDKPRVPHKLAMRRLLVSVVSLDGGGSGIRLDAQVIWLNPRSEAMTIRGARFLTINAGDRKIEIDKPVLVRRLARMLNEADLQAPVLTFCPQETPEPAHPRLTFRVRRGGSVIAYAHVRPTGCARADMVVGGKRYEAVDLTVGSGAKLLEALRKLGALPREATAKQRS